MTTGMPELGSKISLISKADIRYEGRLFTVDPQECTIALASVRSFGTEERETQFPVPAQNQVYDYILFRGSDIKDIRVVNNVTHPQPLNDPAIMQLSVPPSLGPQQFQNHPVLGHMGAQMGQFGPAYGTLGPMGLGAGMGPGMGMQGAPGGLRNTKPTSVLDLIGGTRSTTPASIGSRKSPTTDQGVQAGGSRDKKVVRPIQPPGQRGQRTKSRERRDSSRGRQENQDHRPQHQQNQMRRSSDRGHQGGSQGGGYQGNFQGNHHNQSGYQGNQQQRGNWTNRGAQRVRGRGRGGFKPNQGQLGQGNKRNTLKFDNDYDFEQANSEFEELKNKLAKVKIDEPSTPKPEMNGETDKKDDSGNETGAGETEQDEDHEVFYDKTKSFFDKISCEAVERAKGKLQRTDWRTERKLNSETFGVAAARRGNYRGRGGFRGMGYRGGYRNAYRQPQRRDNNQQPSSSQSQQQPQPQGNSTTQNSVAGNEAEGATTPAVVSEDVEKESENIGAIDEATGTTVLPESCAGGIRIGGVPEPAMAVRQ